MSAWWWIRAAWRAKHLPRGLALRVALSGYLSDRGCRWWPWTERGWKWRGR